MAQVIKKGLETSIQDYPGRIGTLNQGFPASGPMDSWSFSCLLYTSPSPRDKHRSRIPSSA